MMSAVLCCMKVGLCNPPSEGVAWCFALRPSPGGRRGGSRGVRGVVDSVSPCTWHVQSSALEAQALAADILQISPQKPGRGDRVAFRKYCMLVVRRAQKSDNIA